jgi:HPt (histidine-containing phosphotransfer) domain-containing protein
MILDAEELLEEIDNDRELLEQMFQLFEADADRRIALIREAIGSGDAATLLAEAHALKGGVGNFFATPVYETAYELEIMGRDNQTAGAAEAFEKLERQMATLKQAIRDLIAG